MKEASIFIDGPESEILSDEEYLAKLKKRFKEHNRDKHCGWPLNTCHDCMGYISAIQNREYVINERRKKRA